jgi:hypothetical protein
MTAIPIADFFICRVLAITITVSAFYGKHTFEILKDRFHTPKAAASQINFTS